MGGEDGFENGVSQKVATPARGQADNRTILYL